MRRRDQKGELELCSRDFSNPPPTLFHSRVTAPYLSSERDVNAYLGRIEDRSRAIPGILDKKGYKMLDFFDMSAVFTYDTATQYDGMHIIGTEHLHWLCHPFRAFSRFFSLLQALR
jgi:hypothetical protein